MKNKINRYFQMIHGQGAAGKEADIIIYGDITSWVYDESDVSSYTLSRAIQNLDVDVINVHINSYGGETAEGLAIYNALRNHTARVCTICDGFACSAASVVFMAGDDRLMNPASLLMIHNAWSSASGDAEDLRKVADDLDTISDTAANVYRDKISITDEALNDLLSAETWINPENAVAWGFATGILAGEEVGVSRQSARARVMSMISGAQALVPHKNFEAQKTDGSRPHHEPEPKQAAAPEAHTKSAFSMGLHQAGKEKNMTNLDTLNKEKLDALAALSEANMADDDSAKLAAFDALGKVLQQSLMADYEAFRQSGDERILQARGIRVLTSREKAFFTGILDAMRSDSPKQALSNVDTVMPKTTVDAVFEDVRTNHPLLDVINFRNTGALVKFLQSTAGGVAGWGKLCDPVDNELSANFVEIDLTLAKLSAYIPVCRAMLDMGPEWLEQYVREHLSNAIAVALETAIVAGTGKDQPIGMIKQLTGAVDGVYPTKNAVTVTDLSPATFGSLLDTLSTGPNGVRRDVPSVILVVNPSDYFTKVFPATTVRTADGSYANNVLPYPAKVIPSVGVPDGHAVVGIASKYFMGLGTSRGGKIEYSDHYKFLDQDRYYAIFLYGYGRATDENAFVYLDISDLEPTALQVKVVNAGDFPVGDVETE